LRDLGPDLDPGGVSPEPDGIGDPLHQPDSPPHRVNPALLSEAGPTLEHSASTGRGSSDGIEHRE